MKKITNLYLLLALSCFSLLSCGKKEPKDFVARKWKYSVEEMTKSLKEEYQKKISTAPDSLSKAQLIVRMEEDMKSVPERLSKMSIHFMEDGNYTTEGPSSSKGKWVISKEGTVLTMTEDNANEMIYTVLTLNEQKFVVKKDYIVIVMVPASE